MITFDDETLRQVFALNAMDGERVPRAVQSCGGGIMPETQPAPQPVRVESAVFENEQGRFLFVRLPQPEDER